MDFQLALFDDRHLSAARERAERLRARLAALDGRPPRERLGTLVEIALGADADRLPLAVRGALLRRVDDELRDAGLPAATTARCLARLGDAYHVLGRRARARARYREALLLDPRAFAVDALADDEVRALPDVARCEMALETPLAWAGAVGVVIGVLPAGAAGALPPTDDPALARAREFLDATTRPGSIAARRRMKELAPELFAAWLEGLSDRVA